MTQTSPISPLQKAIFDALVGDGTLVALLATNTSVYDFVPENDAFPYLTIGSDSFIDWSTHTGEGLEGDIEINTWSQKPGRKQCKDIMDEIYRVLHENRVAVPGFTTALFQFDLADIERDPDGKTFRGIQIFKILIGR